MQLLLHCDSSLSGARSWVTHATVRHLFLTAWSREVSALKLGGTDARGGFAYNLQNPQSFPEPEHARIKLTSSEFSLSVTLRLSVSVRLCSIPTVAEFLQRFACGATLQKWFVCPCLDSSVCLGTRMHEHHSQAAAGSDVKVAEVKDLTRMERIGKLA